MVSPRTASIRPKRFTRPSVAMTDGGVDAVTGFVTSRVARLQRDSGAVVGGDRLEDDPNDDPADHRDDGCGEQPLPGRETELERNPAADDGAEDPDDDVGQAAARRSTADDRAGQGAAEKP